jgi:hypothetical protein
MIHVGWDSIVVIATCYGLHSPKTESEWGARYFAPTQTGPDAHPASCTVGTGSLTQVLTVGMWQ